MLKNQELNDILLLSTQDLSVKFDDAAGSSGKENPNTEVVDLCSDTTGPPTSMKRSCPYDVDAGSPVFLIKNIKTEKE